MTGDEFKDWIDYHGKLVSGFRKWYAGQDVETVKVWIEGLASVTLQSAKQASKDMLSGEIESPAFGRHLAVIRRRAAAIERQAVLAERQSTGLDNRRESIDGQEVFRCPDCKDSGLVEIYHPVTVDLALRGKFDSGDMIRSCACACSCEAGNGDALPVFEHLGEYTCRSSKHSGRTVGVCMIPFVIGERVAVEAGLLDGVEAWQSKGRVAAFDDFNAGVA